MKEYEITEFEYYTIITCFLLSIPLVIDAAIRMIELNAMIGG